MTISRCSFGLAFTLLLTGCFEKISDEDLICNQTPGYITNLASTSAEQIEVSESCIHKWAYRLGRAPGSNTEIAKATIAACRESIDRTLELKVDEANKSKVPLTNATWQLFLTKFDDKALYRVTQGRAGNCSIRGVDQK